MFDEKALIILDDAGERVTISGASAQQEKQEQQAGHSRDRHGYQDYHTDGEELIGAPPCVACSPSEQGGVKKSQSVGKTYGSVRQENVTTEGRERRELTMASLYDRQMAVSRDFG